MKNNDEPLVNGTQCGKSLGIGRTKMTAIKKLMGITACKFFASDVRRWLQKNPNVRIHDAYPIRRKTRKPQPYEFPHHDRPI